MRNLFSFLSCSAIYIAFCSFSPSAFATSETLWIEQAIAEENFEELESRRDFCDNIKVFKDLSDASPEISEPIIKQLPKQMDLP